MTDWRCVDLTGPVWLVQSLVTALLADDFDAVGGLLDGADQAAAVGVLAGAVVVAGLVMGMAEESGDPAADVWRDICDGHATARLLFEDADGD